MHILWRDRHSFHVTPILIGILLFVLLALWSHAVHGSARPDDRDGGPPGGHVLAHELDAGDDNIPKFPRLEFRDWSARAAAGDAEAEFVLGTWYLSGTQGRDYLEAVRWYQAAAEAGHAVAQYMLGTLYEKGQGVPTDLAVAAEWWRGAARQGYVPAAFELGYCYAEGLGVERDFQRAYEWWSAAASKGYAPAQFNLAVLYFTGRGVVENQDEAVRLFRLSARQGFPNAVNLLRLWGDLP